MMIIIALIPLIKGGEYPVYSIDGEGSSKTISNELDEILKNQIKNTNNKIYTLGNLYMTSLQSIDIVRDIDANISLSLPSNIGDLGSDHPRLLMALRNNMAVSSFNTRLDINQPKSIIQSTKDFKSSENYNNLTINCTNDISDFVYNIHRYQERYHIIIYFRFA